MQEGRGRAGLALVAVLAWMAVNAVLMWLLVTWWEERGASGGIWAVLLLLSGLVGGVVAGARSALLVLALAVLFPLLLGAGFAVVQAVAEDDPDYGVAAGTAWALIALLLLTPGLVVGGVGARVARRRGE